MALNVGELYASFGIDSKGLDGQLAGIQKQCQSIASGLTQTGSTLQSSLTKPIVNMGKAMYTAGTSFEAQMSKVQAIAGLDSSIASDAEAIQALTAAALEMGSTTQFTATEAGEALEYMAMAGWKSDSMLAGLKPIMDLAAASGENLGRASDIVTDAMTAFGLTLDAAGGDTEVFNGQVQHFADVLAATATNANTNVGLMGESFKYVAPLAGSLGFKIDDVAVALGLMANTGIKGSQAGTSLSRVLQNMIKPSKSAQIAMDNLGLSLYDGNGKVKDFSEVMQDMRKVAKESGIDMKEIQKAVADLDTQLEAGEITEDQYNKKIQEMAGSSSDFLWNVTTLAGTRGLGAMLAIMNASESDFNNLTEAITHCDGATAKMAQTMLDNAKGDVTIFNSALEGLEITLWTLVSGPFRSVVQTATKWVDSFRKMNPTTQTAVLKMAGLAAAAGPVMIAAGKIVSLVGKLAPMLGALVSPMGIIAGGLALMAVAAVDANNDIGRTLQKMSKSSRRHLEKFNKSILTTFETISKRMPALTNSLSHIFKDDLPTAIDTFMLTLQGMSNVISENSGDILNVGLSLIEGIATGISRNLPALIPAGVQMVSSIAASIAQGVPRLITAAGDIALAIGKGLLNTDWLGAGNNIITGISTGISNSLTAAKSISDKLISLINNNFTAENIKAGLTNAKSFAENMFSSIVSSIGEIGTTGSEIVTSIVGAINGVLGSIGDKDFAGQLGGLATSIINGIVDSLVAIGTAGSEILTSVINGITSILGNITSADFTTSLGTVASAIMSAIGEGISTLGTSGSEIVSSIVTSISTLLGTITGANFTGTLGTLATAIIDGIVSALVSLGTAGGDILTSVVDGITSILTQISADNFSGLNSVASAIMGAIGNGITTLGTADGDILTNIVTSIGNLLGTITSSDFTTGLGNVASTLITGLGTAIGQSFKNGGDIISGIATMLSTSLSGGNISSIMGNLGDLGLQIVTAIGEAIKSAAGGAASLISAVGELLSTALGGGANGESLIGDLSGLGSAIITAIVQSVSSVVDAGAQIATAIGNALSSLGDSGFGTALGTMATTLVSTLATELTNVDMSAAVTAIGTGLGKAASGIATACTELIAQIIIYLSDPASWAVLGQALESILGAVLQGALTAAVTYVDEGLGGKLTQIFGDLPSLIQKMFGGGGQSLGEKLLGGQQQVDLPLEVNPQLEMGETPDPVDYSDLYNDPVDVDVPINANAEVIYTEPPDTISFQDLYSEPQDVNVPVTATADVTPQVDSASGVETDFEALITQQLQADNIQIPTTASSDVSITNVTTTLGEGTDIQTSAQTAVDTALSAVNLTADVTVDTNVTVNVSDSNADTIGSDLGTSLGTAMATGISGQTGTVASAAAGLATAAMGPINNSVASAGTIGTSFGSGYASGISGQLSAVASAAAGLATGAMNALNTGVKSASTLGSNLGDSFASGISSKSSAVYQAAYSLAQQAMDAVKSATQQGSPSRVMIKSGKFFGEGFRIGISDKIKAVARESSSMAKAAVNALSANSPAGIFGDANKQLARSRAVDYGQLARALSAYPNPVLELDGKQVASVNSANTAKAQNSRTRVLSMRYGGR